MTRRGSVHRGRRRGLARRAAALCVYALAACALVPARAQAQAQPQPRILSVIPARHESTIVCAVETRGLPDASSRETLASGLPSAVIFACSVLDAAGKPVGGSRAEVRIEPDLWDNVFMLRAPAFTARAGSLAEAETMLARMNPLPVLPLRKLREGATYRVRVRMAVEPLAPSEVRRTRGLLTGEAGLEDPSRREVSVGFDTLLRFFLGKGDDEAWVSEATSAPFRLDELPAAAPATGSGEK